MKLKTVNNRKAAANRKLPDKSGLGASLTEN